MNMDIDRARVRQSNQFVMSRLSSDLTLQQQKLILMFSSKVKDGDVWTTTYELTVKEVSSLLGFQSKTRHTEIKKTITDLGKSGFLYEDDYEWKFCNWFIEPTYVKNTGVLKIKFTPTLFNMIKDLKSNFTPFKLNEIIDAKCSYSIKIFQALKKVRNQTHKEFTIELTELKLMLGIQGKKGYDRWNNLKVRVIEASRADLDENSTISFDYDIIKRGRSVHAIRFKLKDNLKKITDTINKHDDTLKQKEQLPHYRSLQRLENFGISTKVAQELIQMSDDDTIEDIISGVMGLSKTGQLEMDKVPGAIINKIKEGSYRSNIKKELDEDAIKKLDQESIVKSNKLYWEENKEGFSSELMESDAYIQTKRGDVMKFSDEDFIKQIDDFEAYKEMESWYSSEEVASEVSSPVIKEKLRDSEEEFTDKRIAQRRNLKPIISGASDPRKGDRRGGKTSEHK